MNIQSACILVLASQGLLENAAKSCSPYPLSFDLVSAFSWDHGYGVSAQVWSRAYAMAGEIIISGKTDLSIARYESEGVRRYVVP